MQFRRDLHYPRKQTGSNRSCSPGANWVLYTLSFNTIGYNYIHFHLGKKNLEKYLIGHFDFLCGYSNIHK